jgi:hypothetical protein
MSSTRLVFQILTKYTIVYWTGINTNIVEKQNKLI